MTNQAKHPADTVVPTDVAPTICSAQYPVALVDVWGETLKNGCSKWKLQFAFDRIVGVLRYGIRLPQFGSRLVGSGLFQIRFQICFRYVSDRMPQM